MARIRARRRESTCKCEKVVGGAIERRVRDAERPCAERLSRVREATRKYVKRPAATREVLMASIENPIHGLRARGTQKYVVAVVLVPLSHVIVTVQFRNCGTAGMILRSYLELAGKAKPRLKLSVA
jgi:hypothetical protein